MEKEVCSVKPEIEGIIDVHSHILPGVDDGSRDLTESISLLNLAYEQGIRAVIATPHYSRRGKNEGFPALAAQLQEKISEQYPEFRVFLGQETYWHEELAERVRQGYAHTMAGSRYILIEFDPGVSYQTLFRGLRSLTNAGYIPLLAHMERYICLREGNRVAEVLGSGVFMQMNYESLEGHFYQSEVRWCRNQVKNGHIHLLGTDMHRLDFRPPRLTGALAWMRKNLDEEEIDRLTRKNAMRMMQDKRLL